MAKGRKMSGAKKFFVGLLVVVLLVVGICVALYVTVPEAKDKMNDVFVSIANVFKSEESKNNDRKENAHLDDRYLALSDDFKQSFDDKFNVIVASDVYKNKTDDEKDEIINKLIESEKIQQDVANEQLQQEIRNEELKQELGRMSEELNNILTSEEELTQSEQVANVAQAIENIKNELQEIIDSTTSTSEEIAQAQEKLEKVDALENEYVANQTTSSITNALENDIAFQNSASNLTLNKINGIYSWGGGILIDAEFIRKEMIAGVDICSKINGFAKSGILDGFVDANNYSQLITDVNTKSELGNLLFTYTNANEDWHKDYFEKNTTYINKWGERGYDVVVVQSFIGNGDIEHPMYIIQIQDKISASVLGGMNIIEFNKETQTYESLSGQMQKICPEFWTWVESEENAE